MLDADIEEKEITIPPTTNNFPINEYEDIDEQQPQNLYASKNTFFNSGNDTGGGRAPSNNTNTGGNKNSNFGENFKRNTNNIAYIPTNVSNGNYSSISPISTVSPSTQSTNAPATLSVNGNGISTGTTSNSSGSSNNPQTIDAKGGNGSENSEQNNSNKSTNQEKKSYAPTGGLAVMAVGSAAVAIVLMDQKLAVIIGACGAAICGLGALGTFVHAYSHNKKIESGKPNKNLKTTNPEQGQNLQ